MSDVVATTFDLVVAVDRRWGIGRAGGLPWPKLPSDLAHFKRVTSAGPAPAIVMGRRTWESIGSKPLPKRRNIVVGSGAGMVPTLADAIASVADCDPICVVGGARLYNESVRQRGFRYAWVTKIDTVADCDTYIDDLDAILEPDPAWDVPTYREADLEYRIERLRRRSGT